MNPKKIAKKIKEARNLVEIQRKNITDEYMQGLYNGMELILSIFESREPRYANLKPKDKTRLRIARNSHGKVVVMAGNTIVKNVTNVRINDITAETMEGTLHVGVEAEITVVNPEINI